MNGMKLQIMWFTICLIIGFSAVCMKLDTINDTIKQGNTQICDTIKNK